MSTQDRNTLSGISIAVLGGGPSKRFGSDKGQVLVNGRSLIDWVLERLLPLSDDVFLQLVPNAKPPKGVKGARIFFDSAEGKKGPLGGICGALQNARYHKVFVVACDMPFLNLSLLRYMQTLAASYDVVIPRIGLLTEGLHAIYSKACLPFIEEQLQKGDLRIVRFFPRVRVRYVEQEEIDIFDSEHRSFFNINTEADLEKARQIWNQED